MRTNFVKHISTSINGKIKGNRCALSCSTESHKKKHDKSKSLKTELRRLPGIGPVNESRLNAKGIHSVKKLNEIYMNDLQGEKTKLVTYLNEDIGIRHKKHCTLIAEYIMDNVEKEKVKEEDDDDVRLTFSIEGNISSGKSTFLSWIMEQPLELYDMCEVVHEPVDMWQKVGINNLRVKIILTLILMMIGGNEQNNLLERFYEDPKGHAYEFQNYVFLTRLKRNWQTWEGQKQLRLMERSVFSDRLVFVRTVHEAKWMNDMQLQLYDSWFNPMLKEVPGLIPDAFIYLRADPSTCMRRLKMRSRSEEVKLDYSYLQKLHDKHESWFKNEQQKHNSSMPKLKSNKVVNVNGDNEMKMMREQKNILFPFDSGLEFHNINLGLNKLDDKKIPEILQGSVIWLGRNGILSNDNKGEDNIPKELKDAACSIPALILDYNEDIDIKNSWDVKLAYSRKVWFWFYFIDFIMNFIYRYMLILIL